MRHLVILTLIIFASVLQSCDERISPRQIIPEEVKPLTNTELLTANPWQYNEVKLKGGSVTTTAFSRISNPPIQLSSDYGKATITYKADGTGENSLKGSIEKIKWKFLSNESQIEVTKDNGTKILYKIDLLTKDNLNQTNITTKASYNDDAFWIGFITNLGFPNTISEFSTIVKLIPVK